MNELFVDLYQKLVDTEAKLATEYNLSGDVRSQLLALAGRGELDEDSELVNDWLELHSVYVDWCKDLDDYRKFGC